MKYTKIVSTFTVKDRSGTETVASKGVDSSNALYDFNQKDTVSINGDGGETLIPFHAIDLGEATYDTEEAYKPDVPYDIDCKYMGEPDIIGASKPLTATAGEEFDPLDGVSAYDDTGDSATITVEVKGE